jgi:hypothetical protein
MAEQEDGLGAAGAAEVGLEVIAGARLAMETDGGSQTLELAGKLMAEAVEGRLVSAGGLGLDQAAEERDHFAVARLQIVEQVRRASSSGSRS